ncbi:DUF4265 domain-containing protein [Streptomyces sp. NPDC051016]|uniref:DUF4265 domain-containing protein n=1 Tax=Streptomyces sp. NPDC051016 TaxID=3365638 RepID=UPI0037A6CF91
MPWFVRGIACGDIVATEPDEEGVRWAGDVVQRSENCTIRLIVLRHGGSGAARFRMVALDVPPPPISPRSKGCSSTG